MELVEGLWQPLRELNFNYSGISVASALRVSIGFPSKGVKPATLIFINALARRDIVSSKFQAYCLI